MMYLSEYINIRGKDFANLFWIILSRVRVVFFNI